MHEENSNGAVLQKVAQTPNAIGYISIGFLDNTVKALPIWHNGTRLPRPSQQSRTRLTRSTVTSI